MSTFMKSKFSESVDGRGIAISGSATPGVLVHTAVAGSAVGVYDEVWLYAYNSHSSSVAVTVEFGGSIVPGDIVKATVPAVSGLLPLIPGYPLQGGCEVRVYAAVQNVVAVSGFVNKIT